MAHLRNLITLTVLICTIVSGCRTMEMRTPHFAAGDYLHQAEMAGAPEYAPAEYQHLVQEFADLKNLYETEKYDTFDNRLPLFVAQTEELIELTRQKIERSSMTSTATETAAESFPTSPTAIKRETAVKGENERPVKLRSTYIVAEGELLWSIARRSDVYGDPLLWPLLYQANRDQIKDPRKIYAGQALNIPRNVSEEEKENARFYAKKSAIFSPE